MDSLFFFLITPCIEVRIVIRVRFYLKSIFS